MQTPDEQVNSSFDEQFSGFVYWQSCSSSPSLQSISLSHTHFLLMQLPLWHLKNNYQIYICTFNWINWISPKRESLIFKRRSIQKYIKFYLYSFVLQTASAAAGQFSSSLPSPQSSSPSHLYIREMHLGYAHWNWFSLHCTSTTSANLLNIFACIQLLITS